MRSLVGYVKVGLQHWMSTCVVISVFCVVSSSSFFVHKHSNEQLVNIKDHQDHAKAQSSDSIPSFLFSIKEFNDNIEPNTHSKRGILRTWERHHNFGE